MDTDRFDDIARILSAARSRRGIVAALLGGHLGLLGLAAADAKKRKGKGKGKGKNKNKGGSPLPPAPTCSDGLKNGSETGIDCGGTCPRCANSLTCESRADCASALCDNRICKACEASEECLSDGGGRCLCIGGVCLQSTPSSPVDSCAQCPANTHCSFSPVFGKFACANFCGAPYRP